MADLNLELNRAQADKSLWSPALTRSQAVVLELVAQGLQDREVAERLCISRGTVKFHLSDISERLGLRGRVRLSRWWWENVDLPRMTGVLKLDTEA